MFKVQGFDDSLYGQALGTRCMARPWARVRVEECGSMVRVSVRVRWIYVMRVLG